MYRCAPYIKAKLQTGSPVDALWGCSESRLQAAGVGTFGVPPSGDRGGELLRGSPHGTA